MGLLLLLIAIAAFIAAYFTYGKWIRKKLGISDKFRTPAHTKKDGVDFFPAKRYILLGHHFASIAGVGPIVGPIVGAKFGWLPVFLWIIIGNIFIGAVHDFTSLVASIRHQGRTIGGVMEDYLGKTGKKVFLVFAWFTLVLVIAVFGIVIANTLVKTPAAGTSSGLFILLAVLVGYLLYVKKVPIIPLTITGVVLLFGAIAAGLAWPLSLSYNTWIIILLAYIFIASVTPVWILLQPRDYLNSFILYVILLVGVLGVVFYRPEIKADAFTGFFDKDLGWLFPILFVTVACGAVSGFHSIVASGTTARQIDKESDSQFIGYGGMLLEGVLGVLALITAIMLAKNDFSVAVGNPGAVFASGFGLLASKIGLPEETVTTFAALGISAFALTTLDTATRLGRYTFQEFFEGSKGRAAKIAGGRAVSTIITVGAASLLIFNKGGTMSIWPLFGSANQMLASLALLTVTAYLAHKSIKNTFVKIPMVFMFIVTISAMGVLVQQNFIKHNYPLVVIAVILFFTAAYIVYAAFRPGECSGRGKPAKKIKKRK